MVLEIEVQGARQVRAAMPEAVLLFIAPPEPAELRRRLEGRGADSREAISERLRTAELELDAQEEFQHVIVNDDLEAAIDELERTVRSSSPPHAHAALHSCGLMIKPRVDELLARTDTHYAAVLVAAKRARQLNSYYRALGEGSYEEYTPPMVETNTTNYLTIALEELAQGKIKYRYRA